ncbi:hypothetical protein C8Q69DRAFT_90635 [Paecilomyces variotii]|uniref:Nucleic acid-binding protein n=1 Tax=Byssochlamys spectabilis TaxID=264951 RepID=A0A443HLS6_BYSSP|nr:hypothetical protein C8Q69DRAFT_90635 [Paecilomyces variotii]KAJ9243271.1 hypothetical protein DTO169E5_2853 [Paecilomyces variotii]KAJ9292343.1 hypothetical protein DTO021C3_236 [Paecilomyces variotii]KAJ9349484.1 hypothetical protein DTO280E4_9026 [Paecilomyces variotii]KAJ9370347.1 hypothetical protein DTO282E5_5056 [Paecilomyces variotii]KAJ9391354.1 hypothetical protein DTO063F5_964 [Paecilomyces variotii]
MQPSTLLRATMPLRSSSSSSSSLSILRYAGPSSILSTSRRYASTTTTTSPSSDQHQHQQQPPPSSSSSSQQPPSPTIPPPPSLRNYPYTIRTGTVISVGLMNRTVRVAHHHTTYDRLIRKTYPKTTTYLVSDPRNSLREGDVIEFSSGAPKSRRVRHVVERIVAPFGTPVEERPAVMSREEREEERARKREEKVKRREERRRAASGDGQVGVVDERKDHVGRIRGLILERVGV